MTEEEIQSLFDNQADGMLISPAPMPADEEENGSSSTASAVVDSVASKEDVQEGIDWVKDLYNTFCASMGDMDGMHEDMHHDDMNHEDMNHDDMNHEEMKHDDVTPKEGDDTTMDGAAWEDVAKPMPDAEGEGSSTWGLEQLTGLHSSFCNSIRQTHGELDQWNNSDSAGKQEIENKYGEDLTKFF